VFQALFGNKKYLAGGGESMIELLKFIFNVHFLIGFVLGGMGAFIYLKVTEK
jgi:hypothetical protein